MYMYIYICLHICVHTNTSYLLKACRSKGWAWRLKPRLLARRLARYGGRGTNVNSVHFCACTLEPTASEQET